MKLKLHEYSSKSKIQEITIKMQTPLRTRAQKEQATMLVDLYTSVSGNKQSVLQLPNVSGNVQVLTLGNTLPMQSSLETSTQNLGGLSRAQLYKVTNLVR